MALKEHTQNIIFCFSIGNPWIGSTQMRVRQVVEILKINCKQKNFELSIQTIERIRPWTRGAIIVATKPNRLNYLHFLSHSNTVYIDELDNNPEFYPHLKSRFRFISSHITQYWILCKIYGPHKIHHIPHHYDPILDKQKITVVPNGRISYIGNPHKTFFPHRLQLELKSWNVFVQEKTSNLFHWAIRKPEYFFEPNTKIATAAAIGAIPIVDNNNLTDLLPNDYPFQLPLDWSSADELDLQAQMSDEGKINNALKILKRVKEKCNINTVITAYKELMIPSQSES